LKTFICPETLYGSEERTIVNTDQKRIEVFEIWCWRRMLKIKLTEKVKNEEVYRIVGDERNRWSVISQGRTRCVGHVVGHKNYVGSIMEGKIEGKFPRGRPRDKYLW
jgi:hypothetical protein